MIKITRETADEFIKLIIPIAKNCIINIMNVDGIIISSSDVSRIGTFHAGAKKVIEERRVIKIYKNELEFFPGSKEGINIPIISENEVLGVVGIYGDPNVMEDAANLLSACVELYLKLLISEEKLRLDKNTRSSLLTEILKGENLLENNILKQLDSIEFKLSFPIRIIILKLKNIKDNKISFFKKYDKVEKILLDSELLNYQKDLFGIYLNDIVILKKDKYIDDTENYLIKVRKKIKENLNYNCKIFMGEKCFSLEEIPIFYSEIKKMSLLEYDICNMDKYKYKFSYLFNTISEKETNRIIKPIYKKIIDYFQEKNIHEIMYTLKVYIDSDFNTTIAAEKLDIHKNTLIYRINKILTLTELDKEIPFLRCFFLQAILYYYIKIIKK